MFSLELPRRVNSNDYAQHTIINIKNKIILNYPKCNSVFSYGTFSLGTQKNEVEKALVNEPSVTVFPCFPVVFTAEKAHIFVTPWLVSLTTRPFQNRDFCKEHN